MKIIYNTTVCPIPVRDFDEGFDESVRESVATETERLAKECERAMWLKQEAVDLCECLRQAAEPVGKWITTEAYWLTRIPKTTIKKVLLLIEGLIEENRSLKLQIKLEKIKANNLDCWRQQIGAQ